MGRRHQSLKPEETKETKGNDLKNNDTWIRVAKDQLRWKEMDKQHMVTFRLHPESLRSRLRCDDIGGDAKQAEQTHEAFESAFDEYMVSPFEG